MITFLNQDKHMRYLCFTVLLRVSWRLFTSALLCSTIFTALVCKNEQTSQTHPNISAVHESPTLDNDLFFHKFGHEFMSLRISRVFSSHNGAIFARSFRCIMMGTAIGSKKVQLWQYLFAICIIIKEV